MDGHSLLRYPDEILRDVLENWINRIDLGNLTIASTNKATRKQWLQVIHLAVSPYYRSQKISLSEEKIKSKYHRTHRSVVIVPYDNRTSIEEELNEFENFSEYFDWEDIDKKDRSFSQFLSDATSFDEILVVHTRLITSLLHVFRLNDDLHAFHMDIKPSCLIIESGLRPIIKNWRQGTIIEEFTVDTFPYNLRNRKIQINLPFSTLLFNSSFEIAYRRYLSDEGLVNTESLTPFVRNYVQTSFKSRGKGDYELIRDFLTHLFGDDSSFSGSVGPNLTELLESELVMPTIVDYLVDVLVHYTRVNEDGTFHLNDYLEEMFFPLVDIWGFMSLYIPLYELLHRHYYQLTVCEMKVLLQLQYIFHRYIYTPAGNQPFDRQEFLEDLEIVRKLLCQLSCKKDNEDLDDVVSGIADRDDYDPEGDSVSNNSASEVEIERNEVYAVLSLPHGRIATTGNHNFVRIWDVESGKLLLTLSDHTNYVKSLLQLPNNRLISGSYDHSMKLWDLDSTLINITAEINDYLPSTSSFLSHQGVIFAMVMLSDGRIASVSGDKTMKIWNVETNQCEQTFLGHENFVLCLTEVKDFQGNDTNIRIATGSEDCTIRLWNVHRGDCERIVNCPGVVYSMLQISDGRLAIAAAGDTILLWNYQKYLEMLLHDGNVNEKSISLTLQKAESYLVKLSGHRFGVTILFELENHRLLSSSIDRKIRIWNVQNGRCERLFSLSTGRLSSITRCKDSVGGHSRFLSSGYDGTIFIWSPVIDESCDLECSDQTMISR